MIRIDKTFKGTVSRDFLLLIFEPLSPKPLSTPLGPFRDIPSSRFATGVIDTGGKWKKSSIRKIFMISFGHLCVVEY
jgi:hypothetical protein